MYGGSLYEIGGCMKKAKKRTNSPELLSQLFYAAKFTNEETKRILLGCYHVDTVYQLTMEDLNEAIDTVAWILRASNPTKLEEIMAVGK